MTSAILWDITQRRVVIPYKRFGKTYRNHLQGSRNPRSFYAWIFKIFTV